MRFGKGLKPNTPHKVAHRLAAHLHPEIAKALRAGPRGSAMLEACETMDQNGSNTCHAHSAAGAIWTAFHAKSKTLPFVPSPLDIASTTYANQRRAVTPPGQSLPPLMDVGAELQDDASALAEWSAGPMRSPTADGRVSDVPSLQNGQPFPEPDPGRLQVAGQRLFDGEYAVVVDHTAELVVAAALDANIPVWEGGIVDSAYENDAPDVVRPAPNENDPDAGGHAQYIYGYRTNAAGYLEFIYKNSWGDWMLNGSVWVSTGFVRSRWALWPMAVAS